MNFVTIFPWNIHFVFTLKWSNLVHWKFVSLLNFVVCIKGKTRFNKAENNFDWNFSLQVLEWKSNRSASPMWMSANLVDRLESWRWTSLFGFEWFTDANQARYIFRTLEVQQHESLVLLNVHGVGEFQMIDDLIMRIITARCFASWRILICNVVIQTVEVFLFEIIE